ncbi:MAG: hypothetical protein AB7O96_00825 [Pseudobdellovibrionaceae bacterium]
MKAGIFTSEFWVTILTVVGSAGASLEGHLDPKWAAIVATISSIAYTISRGLAKVSSDPKM